MASPCPACGRSVDARLSCPDCGDQYCPECLLPDEHGCPGYQGAASSSTDDPSISGGTDGTGSAGADVDSALGCPACGVVDAFLYTCPDCGVSHCADCRSADAHGCVPTEAGGS
jgi:hypothetical protein